MDINKTTLANFRNDFDAAVKELEAKYNVSMSLGNIKYGDDNFYGKVTVINKDETTGEKIDLEAQSFTSMATLYGLKASDLGRTFVAQGQTFKITGLKTRNRKLPIIASSNGRSYKFPADRVVSALNS